MITPERRKEIKARIEAASSGPWKSDYGERVAIDFPTPEEYDSSKAVYDAGKYSAYGLIPHGIVHKNDADFIAHARQDIPDLLETIDELEEQRDKMAQSALSLSGTAALLLFSDDIDKIKDTLAEFIRKTSETLATIEK